MLSILISSMVFSPVIRRWRRVLSNICRKTQCGSLIIKLQALCLPGSVKSTSAIPIFAATQRLMLSILISSMVFSPVIRRWRRVLSNICRKTQCGSLIIKLQALCLPGSVKSTSAICGEATSASGCSPNSRRFRASSFPTRDPPLAQRALKYLPEDTLWFVDNKATGVMSSRLSKIDICNLR